MIAMDVARDDMDLLVVTENGYGKRTQIGQYRKTNRGAKGVKTIGLTEKKGAPRRSSGRARPPGARVHQRRRDGPANIRRRHLPAGPLRHRGAGDEPQGRRLVSAVALVVDTGEGTAAGGGCCTGVGATAERAASAARATLALAHARGRRSR